MSYELLGLRRVVNGVGPATRLGGLPLHPDVLTAMGEATRHNVRMDHLQDAAGRRLAALLDVPACYVTSGAAAALTLATAAAMAGDDPRLIDRLPEPGPRHEVVVQLAHRDPYDHAVTAAGARLVTVGYPGSTHPDELARALTPATAAVLWRPGRDGDLLALRTCAEIAHRHGVPVIVDGALFVPPVDRLRSFLADGADLVAVSGGKGLRGPQASGLLCGRPDLVAAVGLHHQDMDERVGTWPHPGRSAHTRPDPPRHGIGRGMKVGREQLMGLLAAVERYLADPGRDDRPGIAELDAVAAALAGHPAVAVGRHHDAGLDVPVLHLDLTATGLPVDEVVRRLATGDPWVALGEEAAWRGVLTVNPMALGEGDGAVLAAAVVAAVDGRTR